MKTCEAIHSYSKDRPLAPHGTGTGWRTLDNFSPSHLLEKEHAMEEEIYKKLAKHLDNLPGGFPPTESGVELRILKRLFTPRGSKTCPLSYPASRGTTGRCAQGGDASG